MSRILSKTITLKDDWPLEEDKTKHYQEQIKHTQHQLEAYLSSFKQKLQISLQHHVQSIENLHKLAIFQKDQQIKDLHKKVIQIKEHMKGSEVIEHLTQELYFFREESIRLSRESDYYKQISERFKTSHSILQKEISQSKKREVQLLRKCWVLQEDLYDIYHTDTPNTHQHKVQPKRYPPELQYKYSSLSSLTNQDSKKKLNSIIVKKYTKKPINLKYESCSQRDHPEKQSISNLHLKVKTNRSMTNQPEGKESQMMSSSQLQMKLVAQNKEKFNIYDDLRQSLRKHHSLDENVETDHPLICTDQFKTIMDHGIQILEQIQELIIKNLGKVREVDQHTIETLKELFLSPSSINILEIILFSYSEHALCEIRSRQPQIEKEKIQKQKQHPRIINLMVGKKRNLKMETQLRKKFVSQLESRRRNMGSSNGSLVRLLDF